MTRMTMLFVLVAMLLATVAHAEMLVREDFVSIAPETFDAYAGWPMEDRDQDFGPFSIAGWFDTDAFQMPIAPPVEIPAIGGDNLSITLHPPVPAVGFDLGVANFGPSTITFYGMDGDTEIVLISLTVSDIMEDGSGPSGYQGFVGYRDDDDRDITRVAVGPIDLYLDNVYVDLLGVSNEAHSLSTVKSLFR